ncbi:MAG: Beta-galactosidase C-terminal domain, partial [Mogibacterium sp.]|nr:Beta-galactosidase C-terminal domain [Mogibacterium sp.]
TSCWIELLEPDTAEILEYQEGKYWSRYAAVTRNRFGSGHAWYIGKMMDSNALKKYLSGACEDAGIPVPELRWPVVCRYNQGSDGNRYCFLLNYTTDGITVPSPVSGTDILTGESVTAGNSVSLDDWGVRVIRCGL